MYVVFVCFALILKRSTQHILYVKWSVTFSLRIAWLYTSPKYHLSTFDHGGPEYCAFEAPHAQNRWQRARSLPKLVYRGLAFFSY